MNKIAFTLMLLFAFPCMQGSAQVAGTTQEKPKETKRYLSEYRGQGLVIMFHGHIQVDDEAHVRILQTQYLESLVLRPDRLYSLEAQLNQLGITITQMDEDPFINSDQAIPYFPPEAQK